MTLKKVAGGDEGAEKTLITASASESLSEYEMKRGHAKARTPSRAGNDTTGASAQKKSANTQAQLCEVST